MLCELVSQPTEDQVERVGQILRAQARSRPEEVTGPHGGLLTYRDDLFRGMCGTEAVQLLLCSKPHGGGQSPTERSIPIAGAVILRKFDDAKICGGTTMALTLRAIQESLDCALVLIRWIASNDRASHGGSKILAHLRSELGRDPVAVSGRRICIATTVQVGPSESRHNRTAEAFYTMNGFNTITPVSGPAGRCDPQQNPLCLRIPVGELGLREDQCGVPELHRLIMLSSADRDHWRVCFNREQGIAGLRFTEVPKRAQVGS